MDHFILHGVDMNSLKRPKTTRFKTTRRTRGNNKVTSFVNNNGQKIRVNYIHNVSFENTPEGQVQCWWDRHIIDGQVMCMPFTIKKVKERYLVTGEGHYCSLRCMLAAAIDEEKKQLSYKDRKYKNTIGYIHLLFNIIFSDLEEPLLPANDWKLLVISGGGAQTIHEFRNTNYNKKYIRTPNVTFQFGSIGYLVEDN